MKGRVYRRGKSWYYRFDIEPDPLTGKRRQVNGSGYRTEVSIQGFSADSVERVTRHAVRGA